MNWRLFLARLPLPMLALAASYGVFSFAQLFVPLGIAIIQAAAFELTYIGLAVTRDLSGDDRRRATTISIGAVVASIIYNTLAGWFHKQPALLESASAIAWLMFAILHGAPLAWVAYLVADLLLHTNMKQPLVVQAVEQEENLIETVDQPSGSTQEVEVIDDVLEIKRASEPSATSGYVYALRSETNGVKIGCTADVAKRFQSIARFLPFQVDLFHVIASNDMYALERAIHCYYEMAGKRVGGEWFMLDAYDMQALKQVSADDAAVIFEDASRLLSPLVLRGIRLIENVDSSLILKDTAKRYDYSCPHCHQALLSKQALGAAVKNGYCLGCKKER